MSYCFCLKLAAKVQISDEGLIIIHLQWQQLLAGWKPTPLLVSGHKKRGPDAAASLLPLVNHLLFIHPQIENPLSRLVF